MQDPLSRRNALTMLGLGSAATIITPEQFSQPIRSADKEYYFGVDAGNSKDDLAVKNLGRITSALRALADDIDAKGTFVQGMRLASEVKLEEFLLHTLQIDFVLAVDLPPSTS